MLKWLGGGATAEDDPMADLVKVKEMLATIPPEDSVRAVQDAVAWLESVHGENNYSMAHRYGVIDLIDVALKRHGQRLLDQYLSLKPQAKFQEGLLWRAAMGYWTALGNAYAACVKQVIVDKADRGGKNAAAMRKNMPQMVARTLRAQVLQIKWILMRYGYVGDTYWSTVADLYEQARADGYLDEVVEIYGGGHGEGTIRQEFLRTLMLGVSSTGGLSPVRQNIAERTISHLASSFVSSDRPAEGCNFFFDLNGGMSPARVLAQAPGNARLFYFGAGPALDEVQIVLDAVSDSGVLPSQLNFGTGVNTDEAADTLLHLAFNWEKELPARDSERRKVATTLQVMHGFDGVLSAGGIAVGAAGVGSKGLQETWVVENASAEGYGMIVPERRGEWLQVGVVLALLPESSKPLWGAGIVRRVETDARGQRRVGIQVISRAILPGTLCTCKAGGERGEPHNVVLLDPKPSRSGYMQMLLRPDSFTLRDELEVTRTADAQTFMVMPSGLVESGPDFDRVRFKVEVEVDV